MKEIVSKKYINALFALKLKKTELDKILAYFEILTKAFENAKFVNIILMPSVDTQKKLDLLLSLIDDKSPKFTNFLKLLAENGRLALIPQIAGDFKAALALQREEFRGEVDANFSITKADLTLLQEKSSQKFGVELNLVKGDADFDGVKLSIESLGVEVSVSKSKIATQMQKHILKGLN